MANASKDQNSVNTLIAASTSDGITPVKVYANPNTHRLLVDSAGGGSVTDVSVVTANGFAGSVANSTTTPAITIETTVTGIVKGNGTAISAAVANTDYQVPITLTTTGTSGAATFNGTTLNIPQYQAAGTYVTSVSGTSNRITSSGGTTPVIDIAATYVGQTSITTLGTITTGVWNGTLVAGQYGGTGVANTGKTITVSGNTTIGSSTDTVAFSTAGNTSVTLPTTGTLATLAGTENFTNKTITSANFSGAQQLAEGAGLRLDAVLSADGTYSGTTIAGTAGTTLAFGDLIYLAAADSRWELTDADSNTTCGGVWTGMCVLAAASDGDPTIVLLQGNIRADAAFPSLTVGAPVYASTTAGDVQTTQPNGTDDVIHVVGFGITADSMYFNPSNDYITHT